MYLSAEELVADGGPSAPVWAFLTAILGLIITNVFQHINTRRAAKDAATKAADVATKVDEVKTSADTAASNTQSISNGFAHNTTYTLGIIYTAVQDIENRMADHLAWHLQQEGSEHHGTRIERPERTEGHQQGPRPLG